jgi:hypothetical protein
MGDCNAVGEWTTLRQLGAVDGPVIPVGDVLAAGGLLLPGRRIFVATSHGNVDIAFDVLDQRLLNELSQQGVKHTSEDILRIAELPDGRIAFLELGNPKSGLAHILERHVSDFASRGVDPQDIPDLIMTALISGQQVGSVRSGAIYEVTFKGTVQRLLVTVGDNGYIVTAYPQ